MAHSELAMVLLLSEMVLYTPWVAESKMSAPSWLIFFRSMVLSPAKAGALISRQRSKAVFFMKCLYGWVFFRRFDGQTVLWFGVMC